MPCSNYNSCNLHNSIKYPYYSIAEMRKLKHRKAGSQNSNQGGLSAFQGHTLNHTITT